MQNIKSNSVCNAIILIGLSIFFIDNTNLQAQGCIAVRHMSCAAPGTSNADLFKQNQGHWQFTSSYRYFKSFRHFVGDVEQEQRVAEHTQVINHSHAVDLGLIYSPSLRWSFGVYLPYQVNDRSSLYEHYGNSITSNPDQLRFHSQSSGIGDLRINASYWLINPGKFKPYNISLGLGVKLPTGDYKATDQFYKLDKEKVQYTITKPVDQSIQLGDGGVGVSLESQAFYQFSNRLTAYFNGFYLSNPRETNSINFSVADQYAARMGVNVGMAKGFSLMGGGRIEGIPSSDLIGGDKGFRRPGYIISAEPGLAYMNSAFSFVASVPVALYRNRTKSYSDKQDPAGLKHGDAAFADYLISISAAYRF